jgi:hypothetical protein
VGRFRREILERTGDRRAADRLTDQDLLREVMSTVGREGRLGASIRCGVSVALLTEGWDASTVSHVLVSRREDARQKKVERAVDEMIARAAGTPPEISA